MRDSVDVDRLGAGDIAALVRDTCQRAGFAAPVARAVTRSVLRAECAGQRRFGLGLLPQMIEHARAGRVDPAAVPTYEAVAPALLRVDAAGGFACSAFAAMLDDLAGRAKRHGLACAEVVNAYPVTSLAALHAAAGRHGLSLVADMQGLVARPTPAGRIILAIGPVAHGLAGAPGPLPAARVPEGQPTGSAAPDFEGPVGPAFRLTHRVILLGKAAWPDGAAPAPHKEGAESGIAVPASLLEKILNA